MDYIYQIIENIRIRATTIANQQYIPDNILRTETESAGNDILELTKKLQNEIKDILKPESVSLTSKLFWIKLFNVNESAMSVFCKTMPNNPVKMA